MNKDLLKLWGIFDVAFIVWVIIKQASDGRIAFYSDIVSAQETALSYGSNFPLILTSISIIFLVSTLFSAYLLIKCMSLGRWVVYAQAPFRVFLVYPSVFIVSWAIPAPRGLGLSIIFMLVVIAIEAFKVISVHHAYKTT